jgi:hypothetical protein
MKHYSGDSSDFYNYMNSPYMREVIPCGCGVEIQRRNGDKHDQTQRHLEWEKHPHDFFSKQLDCKCGLKYTKSSEDEHRKSKDHKGRINSLNRTKGKQIYTCECGITTTLNNKYSHERSTKHYEWKNNNI